MHQACSGGFLARDVTLLPNKLRYQFITFRDVLPQTVLDKNIKIALSSVSCLNKKIVARYASVLAALTRIYAEVFQPRQFDFLILFYNQTDIELHVTTGIFGSGTSSCSTDSLTFIHIRQFNAYIYNMHCSIDCSRMRIPNPIHPALYKKFSGYIY